MGACLTFEAERVIPPGKPLALRYGLYVHSGTPAPELLDARWKAFAETTPAGLDPAKK
jgi:hypothetical protein